MYIAVEVGVIYLSAYVEGYDRYDDTKHAAGHYLLAVDLALSLPENLLYVFFLFVRTVREVFHSCCGVLSIRVESIGISRQKRSTDTSVRNFCRSAIQQSLLY